MKLDYYKIAKRAYCSNGDQWDCKDCELVEYFKTHNLDAAACREYLITKMVEQHENEIHT